MVQQFIDFAYVKANADFRDVLKHYAIGAKGGGDELRCQCPFHDDETPSMSVNLNKKVFTCHAASCGEKGNILEFVWRIEEGSGLRQAATVLAEICHIPVAAPTKRGRQKARRAKGKAAVKKSEAAKTQKLEEYDRERLAKIEAAETKRREAAEAAINEGESASFFADDGPVFEDYEEEEQSEPAIKPLGFKLKLDPEHEYGVERGLNPNTITRFEMGYSTRGIMKGRWCIPIHDEAGNLIAYAGRWVGDERPKDEPKYKLPPGFKKSSVLFNLHRVLAMQSTDALVSRRSHVAVVVEGIFDAIRLHELGVPAVALLGSSLSEEQVALFRKYFSFAHVMLDGSAIEARRKVAGRLVEEVEMISAIVLPAGEDPESVDEELFIDRVPVLS